MNRKFTAFLTSAVMILTTCACGEKNTGSPEVSENTPLPVTQTLYKEESLTMPKDYYSFEHMEYAENLDNHYIIYDDFSGNTKVCIMDSDFNIKSTEILCENGSITECMYDISPNGEISQLKYICNYDYPENSEFDEQDYLENAVLSFELATYDSNGKFISETTVEGMEDYYSLLESRTSNLVKTGDTYIANFYTSLVRFNSDGKILDTAQSDKGISFIGTDNSGKLASSEFKTLSFYKENSLEQTDETIEATGYLNIGGSLRRGTDGYRMYMRMNEGYFGLTNNGEFVKILDFAKSDIISSEIYEICIGSKGHIMMFGQNNSGMQYISKLTVRPDDYVENKQTITLGVISDYVNDSNKTEIIEKYNKKSDDYKVEIKGYEDFEAFRKAILSGDSPDIFCYNENFRMYRYADADVFVNMYDLMNQYGGFSKDDICENVLNALEYKGGLYGIGYRFGIDTIVANSEAAGKEYTNWNYDDMYRIAGNMPENMYFTDNTSANTRKELFDWFSYNPGEWIDYQNTTCNFNSESFIKYLEFCRDVPMPEEFDWSTIDGDSNSEQYELFHQEINAMLKNKKSLITDTHIDFSFSNVMNECERLMIAPENLTIVGKPGSGDSNFMYINNMYSVVSSSDCVEGAWDYINYIMSPEFQDNQLSSDDGTFFTLKSSFDRSFQLLQQTPASGMEKKGDITYSYGRKPLSKEAIENFVSYVKSCNKLMIYDENTSVIMDEEFNEFINGTISAEECAERIQSRVSIYLAENK